jgi:uncharacterized protein (DUF983 family)
VPNPVRQLFVFARARWRRARGRCPLCNRNLHATFANYMAGHPNCPACKDQPTTDARSWHGDAVAAAEGADAAGVGE